MQWHIYFFLCCLEFRGIEVIESNCYGYDNFSLEILGGERLINGFYRSSHLEAQTNIVSFLFHYRQSSQDSSTNNNNVAVLNGAALRRPQTLMSPSAELRNNSHLHGNTIELTIHKDAAGYGMKVSGDNPVFVESVKPGQAAHNAGLLAGDMILKVNGTAVRVASHLDVVKLIKASEIVKLTIQRSISHAALQQRPQSMSASMSNSPSTPIAQRSSITAPLPVDVS